MVTSGIQTVDLTKGQDLEHDLQSAGYSRQYRILDAYTILHLRKGHRIFPFSIVEINKKLASSPENGIYLQVYSFSTRDLDCGYLMYPAGSYEARLCEQYYQKCLVARSTQLTKNYV